MIEFGNPWMLLGLLLALLPVALHLFGRRKAPTVPFSALAFVLQANPKRARALRMSEWLLVALRALALALLALALSRPMVPVLGNDEGLVAGDGPVALVLVLDDSMSTLAQSGGTTLLERARTRALALVERLPTGSQVGVVAAGFPARALTRQLSGDRGAVLDAIRRLDHHPRRDDAPRALSLAEGMLATAALDDRRVVVMTDLQTTGWQGVSVPRREPAERKPTRRVHVRVDRLEPTSRENTAIVDAVAVPAAERGPGQVRVDLALAHFGSKPFRDYVTLRAGDREIKSLVEMRPGETLRRSYVLPASAPVAEILLPDDGLKADNRRLLRLDGGATVRIALVNGAPRPVPREDEVFFAARALELSAAHPGEIAVDVLQVPGLGAATLQDYDVIVLANVGDVPAELKTGLQRAVESGKGLLVSVGDNLPEDAATLLPTLLPAPLHGQRVLAPGEGGPTPAGRTVGLRLVAADPAGAAPGVVARLRQTLSATVGEALAETAVTRYALVEPGPELAGRVVLRYSDGAPALVVAPQGRGLVGLLTTSLDRDWSDLPLQPGYLPLLHDLTLALAGERGLERKAALEVGDVGVLSRDERAERLEIRVEGESGPAAQRVLAAASQRGAIWQIPGLDTPGRYTATELRGGVAVSSRPLIVVPPVSESNLAALPQGPVSEPGAGPGSRRARPRAPGWTGALVVMLALLAAEGTVLARGQWRAGTWLSGTWRAAWRTGAER